MVCRNKDKAEEARADIVKETGNKVWRDPTSQTAFLQRPNGTLFICLNVLTGRVRPHPGPVRDQEGVGVCRGLQEEVQGPQRAGESHNVVIFYVFTLIRLFTPSALASLSHAASCTDQ